MFDSVQPFKKGTYSSTLLSVRYLDVDPRNRGKAWNTAVVAIIPGPSVPKAMRAYMIRTVQALQRLAEEGMEVTQPRMVGTTHDPAYQYRHHVYLWGILADTPARIGDVLVGDNRLQLNHEDQLRRGLVADGLVAVANGRDPGRNSSRQKKMAAQQLKKWPVRASSPFSVLDYVNQQDLFRVPVAHALLYGVVQQFVVSLLEGTAPADLCFTRDDKRLMRSRAARVVVPFDFGRPYTDVVEYKLYRQEERVGAVVGDLEFVVERSMQFYKRLASVVAYKPEQHFANEVLLTAAMVEIRSRYDLLALADIVARGHCEYTDDTRFDQPADGAVLKGVRARVRGDMAEDVLAAISTTLREEGSTEAMRSWLDGDGALDTAALATALASPGGDLTQQLLQFLQRVAAPQSPAVAHTWTSQLGAQLNQPPQGLHRRPPDLGLADAHVLGVAKLPELPEGSNTLPESEELDVAVVRHADTNLGAPDGLHFRNTVFLVSREPEMKDLDALLPSQWRVWLADEEDEEHHIQYCWAPGTNQIGAMLSTPNPAKEPKTRSRLLASAWQRYLPKKVVFMGSHHTWGPDAALGNVVTVNRESLMYNRIFMRDLVGSDGGMKTGATLWLCQSLGWMQTVSPQEIVEATPMISPWVPKEMGWAEFVEEYVASYEQEE
ncbi:hypothetical protein HYH02_015369 [Chlamydomonas schloesseri]|uniref:Uncharacterized protein n=1 Tax=Chlamydomonas schloesseri TaxID=2026947 RepID=A0A835SIL7_9CHLO|nr:hypothetical protein HYH02_015369 [Chlamydomonas schloesseri]|eukprot:KAG2423079.1 hypothetical protein HYH02_015369 [Chlamydomonas schloesseri]